MGIIKKSWDFVWKSNSLLSWLISLALAFLLIKFIFFPLISLALGTSLPLVIVESGSMHHPGSFIGNVISSQENVDLWWAQSNQWYTERGMDKSNASQWDFRTGMEKGDIIIVSGVDVEKLKIGDVIVFNAYQQYPVIHRIVNIDNSSGTLYFQTKGDNNFGQLSIEKKIQTSQILGKAVYKVPKLGWVKLAFVGLFNFVRQIF